MIKKNVDISLFLLISIAVIIVAGGLFIFWIVNRDPLEGDIQDDRVLTILFIIDDDNNKPIGSYVILYYPPNKRVAVFEIPGEMGLILEQLNKVDRIDTVYNHNRLAPYQREIEKLLALKINYSIVLDMKGAANIVDLLDGVTVFIPGSMKYYDGENSVLFPSGLTKLDGGKVPEYLTFNNSDFDIEAQRQRSQRFFIGLLKRLGEKKDYFNNEAVTQDFARFAKVNVNNRALNRLINELSNIDTDRLTITGIGGYNRLVSDQILLIPYYDGTLIKEIVSQTLGALTRNVSHTGQERVWTVEVLNGTNAVGLANRTAELIRGFGYDVLNVGNADRNNYDKTEIIDRSGVGGEAKKFADIINCENIREEAGSSAELESGVVLDMSLYDYKADFTLIIGRDFNGRYTTQ
jgi:anionic cell wall polymer biosynthesis LytR-Cps2A-Psr (LCP) family protein